MHKFCAKILTAFIMDKDKRKKRRKELIEKKYKINYAFAL